MNQIKNEVVTQDPTGFTNGWIRELDKLRKAIREALSCKSEEEMRSVLSEAIK